MDKKSIRLFANHIIAKLLVNKIDDMTGYDVKFLRSVKNQIHHHGFITEKQYAIILRIDYRYSDLKNHSLNKTLSQMIGKNNY